MDALLRNVIQTSGARKQNQLFGTVFTRCVFFRGRRIGDDFDVSLHNYRSSLKKASFSLIFEVFHF